MCGREGDLHLETSGADGEGGGVICSNAARPPDAVDPGQDPLGDVARRRRQGGRELRRTRVGVAAGQARRLGAVLTGGLVPARRIWRVARREALGGRAVLEVVRLFRE